MSGKGLYRKWNTNMRILEDCLEALVGAVYLDMGMVHAKNFFLGLIEKFIDMDDMMKDRNYKDALMREMHARSKPLPVYECEMLVQVENEKRVKYFRVSVCIDAFTGAGRGKTKKIAEQAAAKDILLQMGVELDD
jgi:ribonuclease-3